MGRTIAVGDIHGCLAAFRAVLQAGNVTADDSLVLLGDYVDRGPDSKGVLDEIITMSERLSVVPLLGNHDEMMLHSAEHPSEFRFWLDCGGEMALQSYGARIDFNELAKIPPSHLQFLQSCKLYHETDTHIFVHANFNPRERVQDFDEQTLRWRSLREYVPPERHMSGKTVVVGHTPQDEVLDLDYLIGLDTGCCYGGWLTAMDVDNKQVWQANQHGVLRSESPTR